MDERPEVPPPPEAFAPPAPARRSRRGPVVAIVVVAVLVLGGVAAAAISMLAGSPEHLLAMVPADTDVFATVYLDPSAGQKMNLLRIAGRFPDLGEGDDLTNRIDDGLDEVLSGSGLTHADVEPWLGSQIGISVDIADDGTPHVAALVATTDEGASAAALAKMREHQGGTWHDADYDGVPLSWSDDGAAYAIVDGVVVLGSESTSVKRVIDAAHGTTPALETSQSFLDTTGALPEGKLGLAYVNVEGLVDQFGSSAALSAASGAGGVGNLDSVKGLALSVSAEPDGLALDMTTRRDPATLTDEQRQQLAEPAHENTTLAFVPSDAFAVMAQEHIDTSLRGMLDTLHQNVPDTANAADAAGITDAIDALTGDVALEARPGTDGPVAGALVLGTDDERTMQDLFDSLGLIVAEEVAKQEAIDAVYAKAFGEGGAAPEDAAKELARIERQVSQIRLHGVPISGLNTEEYHGVTITSFSNDALRSVGVAPAYAVLDGAAAVATSPDEIRALIDTEASGDDVRSATVYSQAAATVPADEGFVFFDVQAIAATVRENLPPELQASFDRDVAPNLAQVGAFAMGADSTLERDTLRMFLLIREKV
jgi:uncharacterized protein DUF3352